VDDGQLWLVSAIIENESNPAWQPRKPMCNLSLFDQTDRYRRRCCRRWSDDKIETACVAGSRPGDQRDDNDTDAPFGRAEVRFRGRWIGM